VHEADARPEVIVRRSHKGAPKNGKVPPVPLFPKARDALARLRALATEEGDELSVDQLVFPTTNGTQRQCGNDGGWGTRKVSGRPRTGMKERAGITRRVRFHDLRHTCASHLVIGHVDGHGAHTPRGALVSAARLRRDDRALRAPRSRPPSRPHRDGRYAASRAEFRDADCR
jgi:integrase